MVGGRAAGTLVTDGVRDIDVMYTFSAHESIVFILRFPIGLKS